MTTLPRHSKHLRPIRLGWKCSATSPEGSFSNSQQFLANLILRYTYFSDFPVPCIFQPTLSHTLSASAITNLRTPCPVLRMTFRPSSATGQTAPRQALARRFQPSLIGQTMCEATQTPSTTPCPHTTPVALPHRNRCGFSLAESRE